LSAPGHIVKFVVVCSSSFDTKGKSEKDHREPEIVHMLHVLS
jgi:hypothetical protein